MDTTRKFGGRWLTRQRAQDGELVTWEMVATHTQHTAWLGDSAIGGMLYVTNQRLLFSPHRFDFGIGTPLAIPLEEVSAVTKQPKDWALSRFLRNYLSGGLSDRLCVTLRNGDRHLFRLGALGLFGSYGRELDEAVKQLEAAIASQ